MFLSESYDSFKNQFKCDNPPYFNSRELRFYKSSNLKIIRVIPNTLRHSQSAKYYHMKYLSFFVALVIPLLSVVSQTTINKEQFDALRREAELTRRETLALELELNPTEITTFGPLYNTYRKEINDTNQETVDLLIELINNYPDITDKRAELINEKIISLDEKKISIRNQYIKKFTKIMSPRKVTKFYIIERILDSRLTSKITDLLRIVEPLPFNP